MASTFLTAPPTSAPTTSSLKYGRNAGRAIAGASRRHCSWPPPQASVTAVGSPAATSCANVGPDSTAISLAGAASRATSCMARPVPASIPLAHSTRSRGAFDELRTGICAIVAARCCAGVTSSNGLQPAMSARSLVARIEGASAAEGRNGELVWRVLISSASSGSRAQSSTSRPSAASICASAVPQAPAPMTPMLRSP